MSAPVDVLAVMEFCASRTATLEQRQLMTDAHDVVAELIKAAKSLAITAQLVKYQADNSGKTPYSGWPSACHDLDQQQARLRAALAACTAARESQP